MFDETTVVLLNYRPDGTQINRELIQTPGPQQVPHMAGPRLGDRRTVQCLSHLSDLTPRRPLRTTYAEDPRRPSTGFL